MLADNVPGVGPVGLAEVLLGVRQLLVCWADVVPVLRGVQAAMDAIMGTHDGS